MNKESSRLEDMQADHRQWDYAHSAWSVDIEHWKTEHESALSELAKLQVIIQQHGAAIAAHAETIERHQDGFRDHERAMDEFQREGGGHIQEAMRNKHRESADRHNGQRAAHERIKKHHHGVMAHLTMLRAAIEAAM